MAPHRRSVCAWVSDHARALVRVVDVATDTTPWCAGSMCNTAQVAMPTPRHRNESCDSVTLFALPGGWEEVETEHGDTFYVDHNDKQTTWERPASAARVVSDRGGASATRRPSHPATRRVGFFSAAAAAVKAGTRWKAHTRSAAQVGPINDDVTVAVSVTPEPDAGADAVFEAAASTVVAVAWDHAGTPVRRVPAGRTVRRCRHTFVARGCAVPVALTVPVSRLPMPRTCQPCPFNFLCLIFACVCTRTRLHVPGVRTRVFALRTTGMRKSGTASWRIRWAAHLRT